MPLSPYWFRAKRCGWGWSLPGSWQGWVVFVCFFLLLALAGYEFPLGEHTGVFLGCVGVLTVALLAICFARSEPPAWRWGK